MGNKELVKKIAGVLTPIDQIIVLIKISLIPNELFKIKKFVKKPQKNLYRRPIKNAN